VKKFIEVIRLYRYCSWFLLISLFNFSLKRRLEKR